MAFRMSRIADTQFDEGLTGSCPGEDVEFCSRLAPGALLLIAPGARLVHNHSTAARTEEHWLTRHAWTMGYLYHRNWRRGIRNRLCFAWLCAGHVLTAAILSVLRASSTPIRALIGAMRRSRQSATASSQLPGRVLQGAINV